MTPDLPPHPDYPAVATICRTCPTFKDRVDKCHEAGCGVAWQRAGHIQRVKDDAILAEERKDAKGGLK